MFKLYIGLTKAVAVAGYSEVHIIQIFKFVLRVLGGVLDVHSAAFFIPCV